MNDDRLARLGMLASALSNRALQVAPVEPGELAWTDGNTIFVDAAVSTRRQRSRRWRCRRHCWPPEAWKRTCCESSSAGRAVAKRYLAIEGHRAIAANEGWLPPVVRALVDDDLTGLAARSDSPAASLALARSRQELAEPPEVFGAIGSFENCWRPSAVMRRRPLCTAHVGVAARRSRNLTTMTTAEPTPVTCSPARWAAGARSASCCAKCCGRFAGSAKVVSPEPMRRHTARTPESAEAGRRSRQRRRV